MQLIQVFDWRKSHFMVYGKCELYESASILFFYLIEIVKMILAVPNEFSPVTNLSPVNQKIIYL